MRERRDNSLVAVTSLSRAYQLCRQPGHGSTETNEIICERYNRDVAIIKGYAAVVGNKWEYLIAATSTTGSDLRQRSRKHTRISRKIGKLEESSYCEIKFLNC